MVEFGAADTAGSERQGGAGQFLDLQSYQLPACAAHVRAWAEKYRDYGLVVVGVHTPELAFERDIGNVRKAVARLKIDYPVVIDNDYEIWKAFGNEYWPAAYSVDAEGRIRHRHFGEHDYQNSERMIQQLLRKPAIAMCPVAL